MKCPNCQNEIREGAVFCGKCGTKLSIVCPECTAENPPDNNFCEKCGYDLFGRSENNVCPECGAKVEAT